VDKVSGEISLDEYKKAYREIEKEKAERGFLIHLIVYIFINAMLTAINFIYSTEIIWFFYPLISWGIGISAHYLGVHWIEERLEEIEAKAEYRARMIKKQ